mgnify:CR=1 FL=1
MSDSSPVGVRWRVRAAGNDGVSCACRQGSAGGCWRGPGRATRMRRRSGGERSKAKRSARKAAVRFATALVGSALALGGCRTDSTFEFKADGSVRTEIIVEDDTGSMRTLKGNCDELRTVVSATRKFLAEGKTEDITPPNGNLTCKITSNVMPDNLKFEEKTDSYTITLPASNVEKPDSEMPTAKTTIIMPGKITKSTIGSVSGNKVTISGIDYIVDGFTITSRKGGAASPAAGSTAGKSRTSAPAGRHGAQAGWSVWVWIGGGCAALIGLAVGGTAIFRASRRRKHQAAALVQSVSARSGAASPRPFGNPDWPR